MSNVDKFEVLDLGSGEAGKWTAWIMANEGHRTAMVERRWLGGSCPNIARPPSKNLIYSARVASLAKRGAEFGLEMNQLRINMAGVQRRKREMVEAEHQFHAERTADAGIQLIMGEGRLVAPKTVDVALDDRSTRRNVGERPGDGHAIVRLNGAPNLRHADPNANKTASKKHHNGCSARNIH